MELETARAMHREELARTFDVLARVFRDPNLTAEDLAQAALAVQDAQRHAETIALDAQKNLLPQR